MRSGVQGPLSQGRGTTSLRTGEAHADHLGSRTSANQNTGGETLLRGSVAYVMLKANVYSFPLGFKLQDLHLRGLP